MILPMEPKKTKQSSSAYFKELRPKFLDWQPPTEEEKAAAVKARQAAKDAELQKVIELAKAREAQKKAASKKNAFK